MNLAARILHGADSHAGGAESATLWHQRVPERVALSASHIFAWHLAAIAALLVLHLLAAALRIEFGRGQTLWRLFQLSGEANVPSFFSAVALLLAGGLALQIGRIDTHDRRRGWWLAGFILLFLALDEAASLHEQLNWFGPRRAGQMSLFWLLPYGVLVVATVATLFPFWLRLPRATQVGLALAAIVYVAGAMGMEVVESRFHSQSEDGVLYWPRILSVGAEETLEMLAVAILIRTLLRHASRLSQPALMVTIRG